MQQIKCDMIKGKYINFPDCWEEVSPDEWAHLLRLRNLLMTQRGVTLTDVRRAWCSFVIKRRGYKFRRKNNTDDMILVDRLADTLDWMWKIETEGYNRWVTLTVDTTQNLLPEFMGLRGPQSHGADLTFGEFRAATAAMNLYTQDHTPSDLLALVAVLYRRPGADGKRLPFDADQLPRYMSDARLMPDWIQWGIYAQFAYFCDYLTKGIFVIDGQEVTFSPVFARRDPAAPRSSAQDLGLNSILYTVAESGVFGTAADTDRAPLLRVLLKLLDDKQRADEMLKRMKK